MTLLRHGASAAVAGVTLCIAGDVGALTSKSFKYAQEQTAYYSVAPMAMSPVDPLFALEHYNNSAFVGFLIGPGCHRAALHLPQASRPTTLEIIWAPNNPQESPTFDLSAVTLENGRRVKLLGLPSISGTERLKYTYQIDGDVKIDNKRKSYPLSVCLDGLSRFYGAKLTYNYQTAGD